MDIGLIWKAALVIGAIIIGVGSRLIFKKLKHDNPIEEIAEEVIKYETGLDIDITPTSPEKKD